jgi:lipoate-protein ligase B
MTAMRRTLLLDLPLTDYREALDLQRRCVEARKRGRLDRDLVILLEHPAVFTLGRRGGRENLLVSENVLEERGIQIVPVERGGDITYHGPGQLVAYLIVDLRAARLSVTDLVGGLECAMANTARHWKVMAEGNSTYRGAWVQNRKLGSIGVTIRRGISFHGLALNVTTDLEPFSWINPCGIEGCAMTSLEKEVGSPVEMATARRLLAEQLNEIFELSLERIGRDFITARTM